MEQQVRIYIEGFFDPLEGFFDPLEGRSKEYLYEKLFGNTATGVVSFDGGAMVVNHEEQYSYKIGLRELKPNAQEKLSELFRGGRKAELTFAKDGSELKIRC